MTTTSVRPLTGRVPAEAVHPVPSRVPAEVIEQFGTLTDATGTIADAMDDLGLVGCVGASTLRPTIPGSRIIGTAVTLRNVPRDRDTYPNTRRAGTLAEMEGHNQSEPGDIIVVQGVQGISNMGAISAAMALRSGELGAIVDGGVRDVGSHRAMGFPVWSTDITPVTGKWRAQTVEVNGTISVQGVVVRPGDLVVADDTGVCFIPAAWVERVLDRCLAIEEGEVQKHRNIADGVPFSELGLKHYDYYWTAENAPLEA